MSIKDGGPAFPVFPETSGGHGVAFHGMSMRDYFAAHANETDIQSRILSIPKVKQVFDAGNGKKEVRVEPPFNAREIARYMHADAMLAAREK